MMHEVQAERRVGFAQNAAKHSRARVIENAARKLSTVSVHDLWTTHVREPTALPLNAKSVGLIEK
jgi:hypothetical protein